MSSRVLGNYFTLQRGTTYKSMLLDRPGPVLLGLASIARNGGFRADNLRTYGGDSPEKLILRPGELYVALKDVTQSADLLGAVARVPEEIQLGRLTQDTVKLVFASGKDGASTYIYWLLRTPQYRQYCRARAIGTTNLSLTRDDFLSFLVPDLTDERMALVELLEAFEEKIELNRRMNHTLEAITRAIFKSWFVDFDPVRAKADGLRAGTCSGFIHLFSDRLQESGIGKIPAGWRMSSLGVEARRCGGQIQTGPFGSQLHASDYVSGRGVPVVMPKNIFNRRVSTREIARVAEADAERLSRYRLKGGDIVYSRRGDVERHAWISSNETGWLCGTGCLLVRMGSKWTAPLFISFALDRPESKAWIAQRAIGATMPNLNTSILSEFPVVVPPDTILGAFASLADPIQLLVSAKNTENETLAELRDTLLPRLISGDFRLRELDRIAEATKA